MVSRDSTPLTVLISGAGIAGPTLAYWLSRYGMQPTIVETAPRLRTGGYVIDFWGAGFEIADRMGLLPELQRKGYPVQEVRVVNRRGRRVAGFPATAVARALSGRFVTLRRADLAAALFCAVNQRVETSFGDSIRRLEQDDSGVRIEFESGATRRCDLVVGADGLHSRVRELAWGPECRYERYLGYKVAAFEADGYRPRDELVYVMYTEVGQQVARFALRDDRTLFLFIFADEAPDVSPDLDVQKAVLRRRFGHSGWECPGILDALNRTEHVYFDRVSQIDLGMESGAWARGRVTLVGDAASCVSLLAGQGSALAMAAAYVLAGELHRAGRDHRMAFARYEEKLAALVREKQKTARRLGGAFAPESKLSMFIRNHIVNLLTLPSIASIAVRRGLADDIALPNY